MRVVVEREGLDRARALAEAKRKVFPNLIVIGMGGSILGTEAITEFIRPSKSLYFLDNPEEARLKQARKLVKKGTWGVLAISKSGTTLETMTMLSLLWEPLKATHGERAGEFVVMLTASPDSPLGKWAAKEKAAVLPMPADLSGRFSAFSTVGTFPLLFAGYDVDALLEGAKEGFDLLEAPLGKNPITAAAQVLLGRPFSPLVLFVYGSHLRTLGRWFQQLWAESLGKDGKFGQLPFVAVGTADQHSILQMLIDVPQSAVVWVWAGPEGKRIVPDLGPFGSGTRGIPLSSYLKAACQGVFEALGERGADRLFLGFDRKNAFSAGESLAMLMILTHFTSLRLGVSTFDQPGVELAKKITVGKLQEEGQLR
jgi:glucose-6-phosphate isomerase